MAKKEHHGEQVETVTPFSLIPSGLSPLEKSTFMIA